MKKKLFFLPFVLFCLSSLLSAEPSRIGYVPGMTAVPFVFMLTEKQNFEFIEYSDVLSLAEGMKAGEIDAANLPLNAVVLLFEKTSGAVVCAAVTQNMNYSVVSPDRITEEAEFSVSSLSDLVGHTLAVPGSGCTRSFVRWILEQNEIPVGQGENGIRLLSVDEEPSAVSALSGGDADAAVLSEPAASVVLSTGKKMRRAIDLQDSYAAVAGKGKSLPITVLAVRAQFADKSYDSFLILLQSLENSIRRINRAPIKAASAAKKARLGLSASAGNAVARGHFVWRTATQSQAEIGAYIEIYNSGRTDGKLSVPDKSFFVQ